MLAGNETLRSWGLFYFFHLASVSIGAAIGKTVRLPNEGRAPEEGSWKNSSASGHSQPALHLRAACGEGAGTWGHGWAEEPPRLRWGWDGGGSVSGTPQCPAGLSQQSPGWAVTLHRL